MRSLAALTANVKRHGAPFRHMLFYGEHCAQLWETLGMNKQCCTSMQHKSLGWERERTTHICCLRTPSLTCCSYPVCRPARHRQDDGGQAPGAHQRHGLCHPERRRRGAPGRQRGDAGKLAVRQRGSQACGCLGWGRLWLGCGLAGKLHNIHVLPTPPSLPALQLHETFDWAERSRRGLLLLIDEADAFLSEQRWAGGPL